MHALPQHKRRNVPAAGFDADFLPPSGKARRAAAKLQKRFDTWIFFYQLGNDFLLPDFCAFVSAFIPQFVSIGMFAVKKPFISALPFLKVLGDQIKFLFYHVLSVI